MLLINKGLKLGVWTGLILSTLYSILCFGPLNQSHINVLDLLPFVFFFGIAPATILGGLTAGFIGLLLTLAGKLDSRNRFPWVKSIIALLPGIGIFIYSYYAYTRSYSSAFFSFLAFFIYGGATIWMGWRLQRP